MTVANIQQRRTSAGSGNGGKLSPKTAIRKICMHPNKSSRGHKLALAILKEKASNDAAKARQELGSTPAVTDNGQVELRGLAVDGGGYAWKDEEQEDFPFDLSFDQPQYPPTTSSPEARNREGSFSGARLQPPPIVPVRCSGVEDVPSEGPDTPVQRRSPEYDGQAKEWRRSSLGASPEKESPPRALELFPAVTVEDHLSWNETENQDTTSGWWSSPRLQEEGKVSAESSPQRCVRGLRNLGNTCYINAVLQMLHSLDSFKVDLETACSKVSAPASENSVLVTLQTVLKELECNSSRGPVNPIQLKKVFASRQERFVDSSQEDAHEFLVYLLDQVQNEVRPLPAPTVRTGDETTTCEDQQRCPIEENFGCTVRNTLQCTNCSKTSHRDEPYLHFTLGMPESSGESSSEGPVGNQDLSLLLDLYFKETTVEYKCEKCEATTVKSCERLSSLPRLLILHLKRLHLGCKSSAPIKFNAQLDMSKWCCTKAVPQVEDRMGEPQVEVRMAEPQVEDRMAEPLVEEWMDMDTACADESGAGAAPSFPTNYRLHAMISHLGGSGECGHFIADAFNRNTNTWVRCDDDAVTPVSSEHIFNATKEMEGYIFVYIRDPP